MPTDATGTPTTNFSFPTYNTSVDAPSGLGLNAIIQDIDSKLASQFVRSTDVRNTNELPVWTGTQWVFQKITPSNMDTTVAPTAWTPTLAATTTNPTLGTGAVTDGAYVQLGKMVYVRGRIVFGTAGVAAGLGSYLLNLPVTAAGRGGNTPMGAAFILDSSAGVYEAAHVIYTNAVQVALQRTMLATSLVTDAVPWVWAANDYILFDIVYDAA